MRRQQQQYVMVPEAFKVLPPLSPELPAPPRAPQPHRVAPPVTRREKSSFVILNDERPPPSPTGAPPPSGRISPFRGRGFKEESSIRYSREPSPAPPEKRNDQPRSRSRSRLPVATPRIRNGTSTSSSPVRGSVSGIPKGINRRNSLSPNRATQVLNQVNRNKSFLSPTHQARTIKPGIQSPKHVAKPVMSPKRVGPMNTSKSNSNATSTKPPLPKQNQGTQKENDRKNLTSPYRKRPQQTKVEVTVTRSPSRIPRTRSISRTRVPNVRVTSPHTSPVRAVVRNSPRVISKAPNATTNVGRKNGMNGVKRITPVGDKRNLSNGEKKNAVDNNKNGTSTPKITQSPTKEKQAKIPEPVEAIVSTLNMVDDKSPDSENMEVMEPLVDISPSPQPIESPPVEKSLSEKEVNKKPVENKTNDTYETATDNVKTTKQEDIPEPTMTLVRTTTQPAMELAQPDLIPTILSKGEHEISKSISEGPSMEDKSENPGDSRIDALASIESVRSTTSVETVRAVTKAKEAGENDVEVLSANNLMKIDENGRNIAWDNKSSDMSPMNNSVHPLDPSQPQTKKKGCCGRLTDRLSCKSCRGPSGNLCSCLKTPASCSKLGSRMGSLCRKLNCCKASNCFKMLKCSCCKKKDDPPPAPPNQRSKLREYMSRLNCFRWSKCCKKRPQTQDVDLEEGPTGCCAGCKGRGRKCYSALFCLNLACCARLRGCCRCDRLACCSPGGCCGPNPPQLDRRKSRMSVRKSQTSLVQGIPKLDATLVEHQSMMRGAIPVLPLPLAWFCCILNVFLPGTGTLLSGVFCMCFGKPRFSVNDSYPSRLSAMLINIVVAVSQLFTVIFCLVGWGWSIWWGVMMVKFARKQKRILLAEKAAVDQPAPVAVNQNHDVERAR